MALERIDAGAGRTLAVDVRGAGPAVLLLHGIPGSSATWGAVADRLADRFLVLAPDLLGFGRSSRPAALDDLWAGAQADAVARALERLGSGPAVVAGPDFGGVVALELARSRPEAVDALALAATNAFADTPIPLPIAAVTWPLVGAVAERALFSGPALRVMHRRSATVAVDVRSAVGDARQQAAIRTIFAGALREIGPRYAPVEASLARIGVPAVVAWGRRDPFFPVAQGERTAAAIPGARLVLLDCGHVIPSERPDELAAAIARLVPAAARP